MVLRIYEKMIKFIKNLLIKLYDKFRPTYNTDSIESFYSRRYLIVEDYVISKNDRDRHFISAEQLLKLYQVDRFSCDIVRYSSPETYKRMMLARGYKKILRPSYEGDYSL